MSFRQEAHIRSRMIIYFIPLAVVPLLFLALFIGWKSISVQTEQIIELQKEKNHRVREGVMGFFQDQLNYLQTMARLVNLYDSKQNHNTTLNNLISSRRQFDALTLLDTQGKVIHQVYRNRLQPNHGDHPLTPEADRLVSQTVLKKRPSFGDIHYNPFSHEPLVQVAVPLTSWHEGPFTGLLLADIRLKKIWNLIAQMRRASGESLFILDEQQRVIAHHNPTFALSQLHYDPPDRDGITEGLHGKLVLLSSDTFNLGEHRFTVVIQRQLWEAFALSRDMLTTIAVVLLLSFIATSIAIIRSVHSVVYPIQQLAETVSSIHQGKMDHRAEVLTNDEIGKLAHGFNAMASQVEETLEALGRSEERFALAMRGANDGLWDWNVRTDEVYYSPRWKTMLGYKEDDFAPTPQSFYTILHPDDRLITESRIQQVLNGELEKFEVEVRLKAHSGRYHHILSRGVPIRDQTGQLVRMVGTHVDLTELHSANAALAKAKQKAEKANLAKSEFLATMSHEIRTPMNAIIGMGDLLLESRLNEEQQSYLQTLVSASDSLLTLLNDILDFSKIESGHMLLAPRKVEIAPFMEEIIHIMEVEANHRNLELELTIDKQLPTHLELDGDRLRQILVNLLNNALKFTEQGQIKLSLEQMVGQTGSQQLLFAVKDSGIGIPLDKQQIIFEKFSQADSSMRRRYGGTGLGLAIVKQLIGRMGGKIWLESRPGLGSAFYFTHPLQQTTRSEQNRPKYATLQRNMIQLENQTHPMRILLAEDSPDNQQLVKSFLKHTPHTLTIVDNGRDALFHAQQSPCDLILMDMQMPIMDGYTATREIRQWEDAQQRTPLPILALTAHALAADEVKSLEAGCTAHLTKPIHKRDLIRAINLHGLLQDTYCALSTPIEQTDPTMLRA
uniref:histidine kinase n=1 Tax=Magnetococcus massalia (strain MO-1) TaxID=451514 RepID=A0A1S7LFM0_MAGMO|nr:putative Histidine kinase with HAMP domain, PAS 3 domain, HisKA domain, HATPase c domain and Response reg domain [Candidatus Magnetococcus massalia]